MEVCLIIFKDSSISKLMQIASNHLFDRLLYRLIPIIHSLESAADFVLILINRLYFWSLM